MRPLSAVELLKVWEESLSQTPVRRALGRSAAASPEITLNTLAELPIGQRDERLMTLREWIFGGRVIGETMCPECHERLELDFHLHDIRVNTETLSADALSFKQNAHAIQFRV